jgi:protein O-mannosyl-transferase
VRKTIPLWQLRAALVAIVVAAYWNAFGLGAALDGTLILNDPRTHAASWANVQKILTTDYWWPTTMDRLYRPATTLSFLLNYTVLGKDAAGYHAVNIALHALNTLLVFALARIWLRREWPAFFAAALWAVHPVGVETVANIAGRADLLATAAVLGALLLYSRWEDTARHMAAMFGLALAAIASKETGAVLIPLLLLGDLLGGKRRVRAYGAALAAALIYGFARWRVLASLPSPLVSPIDNPLTGAGFWQARWTAIRILGQDLWLLLFPARLVSDRSFDQVRISGLSDAWAWIALAVVLAIAGVAIARRREEPALAWAAGLFALTLLPASNLLVLIGAPMAERFLYLPAAGFCIAMVFAVYRFAPGRVAAALLAAAAVVYAGRTLARNPDWNDNLALMAHDSTVSPRSFRLHFVYGESLYLSGPKNLDAAITEVEKAWAIVSPLPPERSYSGVPSTLGGLYLAKSEWQQALPVLQRADEIDRAVERAFDRLQAEDGKPVPPRIPSQQLYNMLGIAYRRLGRYREALDAFRYARGMAPSAADGYDNAAATFNDMGDAGGAAVVELEKALAMGTTSQALAQLAPWYGKLPDGGCAVVVQGGVAMLNPACPRIQADLCHALPELAATFRDARQPARAAEFERMGQSYGCPRL